MEPLAVVAAVLAVASFIAVLIAWSAIKRLRAAMMQLRALDNAKRSQSTRYGQITEQFAPFMASWPWDPKRFKFLGDPIDGIQFTDEGIVLVEIKSASSRLSTVQRQVRDHVQAGRVAWKEVRVE